MPDKSSIFFPDLCWHERSFAHQKGDVTVAVLRRASIELASCVVDVGCGAGQTLRIVRELNPSAPLIGVDADGAALVRGRSLDGRVDFVRGHGERLPIADGVASHVICRVAINYMHQERALREMARVLGTGQKMIVSFIGAGYSLKQFVFPERKGLRQRIGNLKDLVMGCCLKVTGFQPSFATFWGRSVPFTSLPRLRRQLRDLACTILWHEQEPGYLGLPDVWWVIIEKAGEA